MAYVDFPDGLEGQKKRKAFWLSHDGCMLIAGWRRQGTPLTKIAEEYIGISKTAFWGWYRSPEGGELRKAAAASKELSNMTVEEALYKRAIGYDYIEQTYDLIEGELRLAHEYHRHVPPDIKAILHWLYNRAPSEWRSIQEPLESTQYTETVKRVLVAMKEVAESGKPQEIDTTETIVDCEEN